MYVIFKNIDIRFKTRLIFKILNLKKIGVLCWYFSHLKLKKKRDKKYILKRMKIFSVINGRGMSC